MEQKRRDEVEIFVIILVAITSSCPFKNGPKNQTATNFFQLAC